MSGLGVARYHEGARGKATASHPIDASPPLRRGDALHEPHPFGSPFGPAEVIQNHSRLFSLSVVHEPVVIERILRHLGVWDPRRLKSAIENIRKEKKGGHSKTQPGSAELIQQRGQVLLFASHPFISLLALVQA